MINNLLGYRSVSEVNLRHLEFFKDENPLLHISEIPIKKGRVRSGISNKTLFDSGGEVVATSAVHQVKEIDSENFVKVFVAGITAMYDLSKAALRVLNLILKIYESAPFGSKKFSDTVYFDIRDNCINDIPLEMCIRTFNKGLKELIFKEFLAPKSTNVFWVNPSLFFKGDHALMITELRKKKPTKQISSC